MLLATCGSLDDVPEPEWVDAPLAGVSRSDRPYVIWTPRCAGVGLEWEALRSRCLSIAGI
jgi:hypothetical protein